MPKNGSDVLPIDELNTRVSGVRLQKRAGLTKSLFVLSRSLASGVQDSRTSTPRVWTYRRDTDRVVLRF